MLVVISLIQGPEQPPVKGRKREIQGSAAFSGGVTVSWGGLSRTGGRRHRGGPFYVRLPPFICCHRGSCLLGVYKIASRDPGLHAAQKTVVGQQGILDLIGNQRLRQHQVGTVFPAREVGLPAGKSQGESCLIQLSF